MNKAINVPAPIKQGEWVEVEPMIFQRACIGQEHSASYNQNIADGHTELSTAFSFSINMTMNDLITNCKRAWYNSRHRHPEVAIELSTDLCIPQIMTYQYLPDPESPEVLDWMNETLQIVTDKKYQEVLSMAYNTKLTTRGKRSVMWLVLDTRLDIIDAQRDHCIIWNSSHAVMDSGSGVFTIDHFFNMLVRGDDDEYSCKGHRDAASIIKTLPVDSVSIYENQYKPTREDRREALTQAKEQLSLLENKINKSVAMYPEPDYQFRPHHTKNLLEMWSKRTSDELIQSLKKYDLSVTFAGAAATILATFELYGKGHETGALIGMTRNANRWITTITLDTERTVVPMATDVVFLWIPFTKRMVVNQFNRRELLLLVAHEIKTQLSKHVESPHYLSAVEYMSKAFTDNLLSQKILDDAAESYGTRHGEESANLVGPSAPGFSAPGKILFPQHYIHKDTILTRHDIIPTGRQVGNSPWINMFSLDGNFRFTLGYDCKYYNDSMMLKFLHLFQENLASTIDCISTSRL